MEPIYEKATQIIFKGATGGSFTSGPFRGVIHTTQSVDYAPSPYDYYGHSNPPHFTLAKKGGKARIYQHYSLKVASRALRNLKDKEGLQTNRHSAIQIEIAWRAENISNLPDYMKRSLRDLILWISREANIELESPKFYGNQAWGNGSISRMSSTEWRHFNGWCGHQHVPENTHWDPGEIDIDFLLAGSH